MAFKFEKLEVWQLALDYADTCYEIASALPAIERFNLSDQLRRAATSIALNIAEGSTGMSDAEQAKFLGYAIRSLTETIACLHLINRRDYADDTQPLRAAYTDGERLFAKLQAFRRRLSNPEAHVHEPDAPYDAPSTCPF